MAKLRDLVNVKANVDVILIQGVEIPIMFSISALDFIQECYGKPYPQFEKDLNTMLKQKQIYLRGNELKLVRSLIYGMVRAGGTECTPNELEGSIPIHEINNVYETVLTVFNSGNFQQKDLETLKKPQNNHKKKQYNKNRKKN